MVTYRKLIIMLLDLVLFFAGINFCLVYAMVTYFRIADSFANARKAREYLDVFKNRDSIVRQTEEKIASGQGLFNELEMHRANAKYAMEKYKWYSKKCSFVYLFLWPVTDSINFVKRMRSENAETRDLVATYKKYYQ